jgi:hypothetical protein
MHQLNENEIAMISGGMRWEGDAQSENVVDRRGVLSRGGADSHILWGDTLFRYTSIDWFM